MNLLCRSGGEHRHLSDSSGELFAGSTDQMAGTGFHQGRRLARAYDPGAAGITE